MSEIRCVEVEHIANVLEYPADHPVRRHTETCPRCRTLVENYLAFMRADARDDAGVEQARSELDAAIARLGRAPVASSARPDSRAKRARWFGALLRPMPAFAMALVVTAAVVLMMRGRGDETPVLRSGAGAPAVWEVSSPALSRDGNVTLSWAALESADEYQVRVYGPELEILATLGPVTDTSLELKRDLLPASVPANADLTYRVVAWRAGSELTVSGPHSVRLP